MGVFVIVAQLLFQLRKGGINVAFEITEGRVRENIKFKTQEICRNL